MASGLVHLVALDLCQHFLAGILVHLDAEPDEDGHADLLLVFWSYLPNGMMVFSLPTTGGISIPMVLRIYVGSQTT